jgi:hypothetical protein
MQNHQGQNGFATTVSGGHVEDFPSHQSSKSEVKDAPSTSQEPKSHRRFAPEQFNPASTSPWESAQ